MGKTTATNSSNLTKIFRRIVQQLHVDPEFSRVFAGNIRSWSGETSDKIAMVPSPNKPIARFTPVPSAQEWYAPDSQWGVLTIMVELAIATLCIDDVADCYDLLVTALGPFQREFVRDLISVGAETGEIVFSDPSFVAQPEVNPQGIFIATGKFRLKYVRMVNPNRTTSFPP